MVCSYTSTWGEHRCGLSRNSHMQCQCLHLLVPGLDGRLRKAPEMRGVQNFQAADYGLQRIRVATWGHLIFLNFDGKGEEQHSCRTSRCGSEYSTGILSWSAYTGDVTLEAQLGWEGLQSMEAAGMTDSHLQHVASRLYTLNCNWKVFCDNYLVRAMSLFL